MVEQLKPNICPKCGREFLCESCYGCGDYFTDCCCNDCYNGKSDFCGEELVLIKKFVFR